MMTDKRIKLPVTPSRQRTQTDRVLYDALTHALADSSYIQEWNISMFVKFRSDIWEYMIGELGHEHQQKLRD